MITSLIWSLLCFILILQDCIAPKEYFINQDPRAHTRRRNQIDDVVKKDPCGAGIWIYMSRKERKAGKKACEDAYNLFVALPIKNQDSCLNASSPKCRPLSECANLTRGCSFECDDKEGVSQANVSIDVKRQRKYGKTVTDIGIFEQEIEPPKVIKFLKDIAADYLKGTAVRKDNYERSKDDSSASGSKSKGKGKGKGKEKETEN